MRPGRLAAPLAACAALTLVGVLGALGRWPAARQLPFSRQVQDVRAQLLYGLDPLLLGRSVERFPAPSCCAGAACSAGRRAGGRMAVVVPLRTDAYLPLLQQLECTLRRSNPGVELAVLAAPGELGPSALRLLAVLNITHLAVQPLEFPNTYEPRYGLNWIKLRAWRLEQYDALLMLDADTAVVGDLSPLWGLPTEFAAVPDQSKWLNRHRTVLGKINGGMLFLRPCAGIEAHMLSLLEAHPKLRFTHGTAEQDFLAWYWRYTGWSLSLEWNAMSTESLVGNRTVGGSPPAIIHYLGKKPFGGPRQGEPGHEFLCSQEEVRQRAAAGEGKARRRGLSGAWELEVWGGPLRLPAG